MQYWQILHYSLGTIIIVTIILLVYTFFPGNWILATFSSFLIIVTLLSTENTRDINPGKRKSILTTSDLPRSINLLNIERKEEDYHSMFGTVFNTMAKNAAQDLYLSEITDTNGRFQNKECGKKSSSIVQSTPILSKETPIGEPASQKVEWLEVPQISRNKVEKRREKDD
ncbi:MAG: hypothetical protein ACFFD4_27715 [Candidatus Odinarchaeota archaeon]